MVELQIKQEHEIIGHYVQN